jgi:large subunit ribosomal protein L3
MAVLLGNKLGMTQIFTDDGSVERVTVVQAGPCYVTGLRSTDRDGYEAVQLGYEQTTKRRLNKPTLGHLQKAGVPPLRRLVEFREAQADDLKVGDVVTVEAFEKGQSVKVSGISKGKGFQGTVKRHNFARGPVTHGSHSVRAPGAIGASATPARTFKGLRSAGQMGNARVTQRGLKIVEVMADQNLLLLRGAVPGPSGGPVEIRTDR